jgi:uncharacterized UPF0160 family protein
MPLVVATHDGPFHADDVMAYALVRIFLDPGSEVVRTRDLARIAQADIVVDVGGEYDLARRRFDHHQASYQGPFSAAGMVLDWLAREGHIEPELARELRIGMMDYLDAVDNGRTAPQPTVPCFPRIVDALNQPARTHAEFDEAYRKAADFAALWLQGLVAEHDKVLAARKKVREAMDRAVSQGVRVLELDEYLPWKGPYFESGGESHPTDYVLHPGTDGSWRIAAIPPRLGDFGQKRPLPEAWAGLVDEQLEAVTGVPGSVFCHKNRFIAVFRTREGAMEAMRRHGLLEVAR